MRYNFCRGWMFRWLFEAFWQWFQFRLGVGRRHEQALSQAKRKSVQSRWIGRSSPKIQQSEATLPKAVVRKCNHPAGLEALVACSYCVSVDRRRFFRFQWPSCSCREKWKNLISFNGGMISFFCLTQREAGKGRLGGRSCLSDGWCETICLC